MKPRLLLLLAAALLLATPDPEDLLIHWTPGPTLALRATLHHVQGIDIEDGILWVSSVDRATQKGFLSRFDLATGQLLQQVEVQDGDRYHPGGIALHQDSLWVPVAVYHRQGPSIIQQRDKRTLALISSFPVPDHIGCLAATPDGLIGGNWDSRILYRWSFTGTETAHSANPQPTSYQDLKWIAGTLIASGTQSRTTGAIDWLDPLDYHLLHRLTTPTTDRGLPYTNEGMTLRHNTLYLLPEDDPSRLFSFRQKKK